MNNIDDKEQETSGEIIAGRNAVMEALRAGQDIDLIYMTTAGDTQQGGTLNKIKYMAKDARVVVKTATPQKLSELSGGIAHQGVVATLSCVSYKTLEDLLAVSEKKGTAPFLLIADEIEDPHNLGAIIRTAEAAGADGLIIPKRRSATLSGTVYKTSAGAASVLPVARVPNLVACIKELKKKNIWIYGAETGGQPWDKQDFSTGGIAIVIGSEGDGIHRLIKEECDFLLTLPMHGQINSLNASVAAGIIMYEIVRQRGNAAQCTASCADQLTERGKI